MFIFLGIFCSLLLMLIIGIYHNFIFNNNLENSNILVWASSFECGFVAEAININSFSVNFFILLIFFVLFDLEISLLINIPFQFFWFNNITYYWSFLVILILGYLYEVISGFIEWEN
uniref:NADH-ubiquinone oxidoreductase chain 3 n=1 Tax=Lamellodiscus spari TaxID=330065 RepID=A0A346Q037_9PLAT|nr:NADH dehydrogenase subunit 3 [Lamellodiscus spari]